jgi:hypothetical protein
VKLDDFVHIGEIDTDTSIRCRKIPFEGRSARKWNDGDLVLVTDFGDLGHFSSGFRVSYRYWKSLNIRRGPLRIAMCFEIFRVQGNGIFISSCYADLFDCLELWLALFLKT